MGNQIKTISLPLIISIAASLVICFSGIGGHDLWTPDEPRVAAISLDMANTGEFIIPHLAEEPFIEKPPLHFAISALMLRLLGPVINNTTSLRLTSALFGLGVLIFTFLIARRIDRTETGIKSALILCTMVGFIQNYHWIRVDTSLSFFIIAGVWCFVEAYFAEQIWLLPAAGALTGCAFLTKGLIGPVLIAIPWTGMVIYWLSTFRKNNLKPLPWTVSHFICLLAFLIIGGIWVVLLYQRGGDELWHEWFFVNHLGRFTGTAVAKGHLKDGQPFYYFVQLVIYGMPWTPLFLAWFIAKSIKAVKQRSMDKETLFLFLWGAGSLVLLSIPTTKRGIYLTPALPAFAVMAGLMVQTLEIKTFYLKWFKRYSTFWISLCLVLLCIIAVLPLTTSFLSGRIPEKVIKTLAHPGSLMGMTALINLVILIIVLTRYKLWFSTLHKMIIATAMLCIALFGLPVRAVDAVKSMESDIRQFVSSIPEAERTRIAGTDFSETMLGSIYYYTGWKVPLINDSSRIKTILMGNDKDYDAMLINRRKVKHKETQLSELEYKIINYTITGRKRGLFLIKGGMKNENKENS